MCVGVCVTVACLARLFLNVHPQDEVEVVEIW